MISKKFLLMGTLMAMLCIAGSCGSHSSKPVFTGELATDGIGDLAFNYFPNNDMMSFRSVEIVPDSTGKFTFPDSLVRDGGMRAQILADNDYFGIYLEKGKSVEGKIYRNPDGKLAIEFSGDNADINTYYNELCQAFDSMKYFSPDPSEGKSVSEYLALLESENEKVKDASIIKNPTQREYYEKLRDRMYTWAKLRLIMDMAYDENKDVKDYPEYVELVNTIDPNDDMSLECTLIFPWINLQTQSNDSDALAYGVEQLHILDKGITNENTRMVMLNQLPYTFFNYNKLTPEQGEAYMKEYSKYAAQYPELIEKYQLQANAIKDIQAGDPLPYDPVIETPEGKKLKLSDLKGKVTYIDFWATWCGPCCKEIPHLEKLVEKMKDNKDVAFVSISSDSDREAWLNKIRKDNPDWPQYIFDFEDGNKFFTAMNINGIPRFIILDANGNIAVPDALRPSSQDVVEQILSCVQQ